MVADWGFCFEIVISIMSSSQISFLLTVIDYPNFVERHRFLNTSGWCLAREVEESCIEVESGAYSVEFRELNSRAASHDLGLSPLVPLVDEYCGLFNLKDILPMHDFVSS